MFLVQTEWQRITVSPLPPFAPEQFVMNRNNARNAESCYSLLSWEIFAQCLKSYVNFLGQNDAFFGPQAFNGSLKKYLKMYVYQYFLDAPN